MRALIKTHDDVTLADLPTPALNAPDAVRVRVYAAGLCRTDLHVASGRIKVETPRVLGHEFAGVVEAVGSDVRGLKPGARVAVHPLIPCGRCASCARDAWTFCAQPAFLGVDRDGAFADQLVVPARVVYPLPEGLGWREAALAEPVAASAAVLNAPIRPEQRGVVYGAGRIAELTARILRASGFERVRVWDDASDAPLEDDSLDFAVETRATTRALELLLAALKPRGVLVLKSRQIQPVALTVGALLRKEPTLRAVHYGPMERALALLASGRLDAASLLGRAYPLEAWEDAFEAARAGESRKILLQLHPEA